jgi:hypothetical protein
MGMSDLAINSAFFWLIRIIVIFMVKNQTKCRLMYRNDIHNYSIINSLVEKIKR